MSWLSLCIFWVRKHRDSGGQDFKSSKASRALGRKGIFTSALHAYPLSALGGGKQEEGVGRPQGPGKIEEEGREGVGEGGGEQRKESGKRVGERVEEERQEKRGEGKEEKGGESEGRVEKPEEIARRRPGTGAEDLGGRGAQGWGGQRARSVRALLGCRPKPCPALESPRGAAERA